ncbi:MAG: hypothetical protein IJW86_03745 [Clostridia bacterium]|nr:hypothetical protein [Clostridia bacterium]
MKKTISLILCLIMLFTVLPVVALSADETELPIEAVGVKCADNRPVSFKEVWDHNIDGWPFFLTYSNITYDFEVLLSDGTSCFDKVEPLEFMDASASEEYSSQGVSEKSQNKKVGAYCEPYVLKQDCLDAVAEGRTTVPLYVIVHFSYYDDEGNRHPKEYRFTTEKEIAPSFAEITPVSGMPDCIYEGTYRADFDNAVFEIKLYDGTVKQAKAESYPNDYSKKNYTLDGDKLKYYVNEKTGTIKITYLDAEYTYSVDEVKECPFSSVKITDCKFESDCLKEISYELTKKDGTTTLYTKQIENSYPDIDREVDFVDGYAVEVYTYSQKNWSTVGVSVAKDVSDKDIYAHEMDNIFATLFAKIYVAFLRIYVRITGVDY